MGKRKEKITLKAHSEHSKIETKHNQKKEPCCKILTLFYFKVSPYCIIEFMAEYGETARKEQSWKCPVWKSHGHVTVSAPLYKTLRVFLLKLISLVHPVSRNGLVSPASYLTEKKRDLHGLCEEQLTARWEKSCFYCQRITESH